MIRTIRTILSALFVVAVLALPAGAQQTPSRNINTGQVTVGTGATLIAAVNPNRGTITIVNLGTGALYVGNSNVTVATGQLLPGVVGASVTINSTAAIYGIAAVAQAVSYLENY